MYDYGLFSFSSKDEVLEKAKRYCDILVTGKGISGGLYPISCVLVNDRSAGWLREDGFGHMSTFGGAELGCVVALGALRITLRPETRANVERAARQLGDGLDAIRQAHPDWFVGVRQDGLVMGLEFAHPEGAKIVMRELYELGVWAIFSTLDPRVLQFKPGTLIDEALGDELLDLMATAIARTATNAERRDGRGAA